MNETISKLRKATNLPIKDCASAAKEANDNYDAALNILQLNNKNVVEKKIGRETSEGFIGHYVHHNGQVAAFVELDCETDFVAKNPEFQTLAREIAMHVVSAKPLGLKREDINTGVAAERFEKEVEGKPEQIKEKILKGKWGRNC